MDLRSSRVNVVSCFVIDPDNDEIMLVTDGGQIIRIPVNSVRVVGRTSKGVKLFELDQDHRVVSVARLIADANGADADDIGAEADVNAAEADVNAAEADEKDSGAGDAS